MEIKQGKMGVATVDEVSYFICVDRDGPFPIITRT